MIEKVGNVTLDLSNYRGEDCYSDGAVEDDILKYVKKNSDPETILYKENRWPILYHFGPDRKNILEWYGFGQKASLLEIGAGCGALTGLFCDHLDRVDAVEQSRKRSEIIAYRYRDYHNLRIKVANLQDIVFEQRYDYVTLIGVLEYASSYIDAPDPAGEMLSKSYQLLSDRGTLILAIENKFGLKYWSGAAEDHTGLYFESLQNYPGDKKVLTFSKPEIKTMLLDAGFTNLTFYYPHPDYKLPKVIYSDLCLPKIGQIRGVSSYFDQDRYLLFDEGAVFDNIIQNNRYDFFANSYLVFAEKG